MTPEERKDLQEELGLTERELSDLFPGRKKQRREASRPRPWWEQ